MPTRALRPAVHHVATLSNSTCSAACACACVFASLALNRNQRRTASGRIRAPSTRSQRYREESFVLDAQERKHQRLVNEYERDFKRTFVGKSILNIMTQHPGQLHGLTPGNGDQFIRDFCSLIKTNPKGKYQVDHAQFHELLEQYGLSMSDAFIVTLILGNRADEGDVLTVTRLMHTLSACGFFEATIQICTHALLGRHVRPGILKESSIVFARGKLREEARRGQNLRALVLEGKIALALGDEDYALENWERALELGQQHPERLNEIPPGMRDLSELSSPWIDLAELRKQRYDWATENHQPGRAAHERAECEKAILFGCDHDDPTSHFQAAYFFYTGVDDSSWLYHMTKAAASGHPMACHHLAMFYAESEWPYIEDEPPDYIKPTPFDRYPSSVAAKHKSTILDFLRLRPSNDSISIRGREEVFHTAVFPPTLKERRLMARHWFEIALNLMYAPSYLAIARLIMSPRGWSTSNAPQSAVAMSKDRYTYASKEDYEAGKPLPSKEAQLNEPGKEVPLSKPTPQDITFAKSCVVQLLQAHSALIKRRKKIAARRGRSTADGDDFESVQAFSFSEWSNLSAAEQNWLKNSYADVRAMWEKEIDELAKEARIFADEQGWDLWDADGGLVHRAGLGGKEVQWEDHGVAGQRGKKKGSWNVGGRKNTNVTIGGRRVYSSE